MRPKPSLLLTVLSLTGLSLALSQPANPQTTNNPHTQVERHPFTVELKTTTVQTLANGTTITRESSEIIAEDSQDRRFTSTTNWPRLLRDRQEPVTFVRIEDPVEGTQTRWNSQMKEVTVLKLPPVDQRQGCWQSDSGSSHANYGPAHPVPGPSAGLPVAGSSIAVTMGPTLLSQAANTASAGIGGGIGSHGSVVISHHLAHNLPQTEDLGASTIEGVEVEGRRMTRTTPAGQAGNDQPLVSTTDSWSAPSLGGIALRSVIDDPLSGKSTTEVVRLDLSEPPLSTFQPPDGYKVVVDEMHQVACREPGQP
jgi:hypothetical protein